MTKPPDPPPQDEVNDLDMMQVISLVLSVYVLIVFGVQTLVHLNVETNELLDTVDFFICIFFLYDFFLRLYRAESKLAFLKWGWIDFVSSIPIFPIFYTARLFRVVRLLRILRAFRSTKILVQHLFRRRAQGTMVSVVFISVLLSIFASIAELNLETSPDSNIKTSEDALWWSFSTITTVACEKYPVTLAGRIVAIMLMAAGVCLFGTIAAFIATIFLQPEQIKEESEIQEVLTEVRILRKKIESLEQTNREFLSQVK